MNLRLGAILGLLCALTACSGPRVVQTVEVTQAELLAHQNERAGQLSRLWARASVQVSGQNADGGRLNEQAEGHLQIESPDRVALSLGKIGKVQLYLGSNAQWYWWMDMVDRDNRSVVIGRHAQVTEEKARLLGVPVYPRDLVHLLGISPIDPDSVQSVEPDGSNATALVVGLNGGAMRISFDHLTLLPQRVELIDDAGAVLVTAKLERYDYVNVRGDATIKPKIPEKITLNLDDGTVVRMSLYAPENKPLRPTAFDLEKLIRGFHIDVIYDLDHQPLEDSGP